MRTIKHPGLVGLLALAAVLSGGLRDMARADSWMPPAPKTYVSAGERCRLTVSPRQIQNQLRYFEDKVDGVEPAGQRTGGPEEARGRLECRDERGGWARVWDMPLVNEVGPVSAVVSDDGAYVATFDNWHSMGWGEDVVAIYDREGRLVRAFGLSAFLPDAYVNALPRSVSSIWWSGEHRIEAGALVLQVVVPSEDRDERSFAEVRVDLASGEVEALDSEQWRRALAEGDRVNALILIEEAEARERRRSPLTAPETADDGDWHAYLAEAFFRLDPDWEDNYPAVKVLRRPEAGDYAPSLGWLRDELSDTDRYGSPIMIGSADALNLIKVLEEIMGASRRGALNGVKVYVAVGDGLWPRVQRAFAGSGASVIQLDPTVPIPQRPERMPEGEDEPG